jgi:hypothetical protein
MQDDTSVILLASNLSQTAPRTSRFKEFAAKFYKIIENSNFSGILRLVPVYSNREILEGLRQHSARMTVLHFEGRSEKLSGIAQCWKSLQPDWEICQLILADSKVTVCLSLSAVAPQKTSSTPVGYWRACGHNLHHP